MAEKYLIVVDMQNDFVSGTLGSKEAEAIVPNVVKKVNEFEGAVIFTKDTHFENYLDTQEGKMLPVKHCIKDTEGWQLISELKEIAGRKGCRIFEKNTFGSIDLAEFLLEKYRAGQVEAVELIGLCTDICVVSNALLLKAYMPELPLTVDASCCAGVSPDSHAAALQVMGSCQVVSNS